MSDKTPIEILTEYTEATQTWFAVRDGGNEQKKVAVWQNLKAAQAANDALEETHRVQMELATRRPR